MRLFVAVGSVLMLCAVIVVAGVPEARIMMGLFEGLVVADPETAQAVPGVAPTRVSQHGCRRDVLEP